MRAIMKPEKIKEIAEKVRAFDHTLSVIEDTELGHVKVITEILSRYEIDALLEIAGMECVTIHTHGCALEFIIY